ncbi:hypothetical protein B0H15DRAFT_952881 [Mycena belliarum]|uniref:Uncharacterized protein n=1 Tax=Mycena belliarum TaxID=1033014 RepID=A0AAD6XIW9_9AGAR|nr:hypothetical protein B0H15DRAFT_952881 [Mycena belliae]
MTIAQPPSSQLPSPLPHRKASLSQTLRHLSAFPRDTTEPPNLGLELGGSRSTHSGWTKLNPPHPSQLTSSVAISRTHTVPLVHAPANGSLHCGRGFFRPSAISPVPAQDAGDDVDFFDAILVLLASSKAGFRNCHACRALPHTYLRRCAPPPTLDFIFGFPTRELTYTRYTSVPDSLRVSLCAVRHQSRSGGGDTPRQIDMFFGASARALTPSGHGFDMPGATAAPVDELTRRRHPDVLPPPSPPIPFFVTASLA